MDVVLLSLFLLTAFFPQALATTSEHSNQRRNTQKRQGQIPSASNISNNAAQEWQFIMTTLRDYRTKNMGKLGTKFFSQQIYNVAKLSYDARKEIGGWAGNLVRESLIAAASDIQQRRDFWESPEMQPGRKEITLKCYLGKDIEYDEGDIFSQIEAAAGLTDIIYAAYLGSVHFEDHLAPTFYKYIKRDLLIAVEGSTENTMQRNLVVRMKAIRGEHEKFLKFGVVPGFNAIDDLSIFSKHCATREIPLAARQLRIETFITVLKEFYNEGKVTRYQVDNILFVLNTGDDSRL